MKPSKKRYVLVEVYDTLDQASETDPWPSMIHADLRAVWRNVREITFRTADVTDWVTPGGNAAFLRSVVEWTP